MWNQGENTSLNEEVDTDTGHFTQKSRFGILAGTSEANDMLPEIWYNMATSKGCTKARNFLAQY